MNFRKTLTSLTLTAFLWCFIAPSNAFAQQQLFKTLEENIKSFYLMTDENYKELNEVIKDLEIDPNAVDQVTIEVYQKKAKDAAYVKKQLQLLNADGSWQDINFWCFDHPLKKTTRCGCRFQTCGCWLKRHCWKDV